MLGKDHGPVKALFRSCLSLPSKHLPQFTVPPQNLDLAREVDCTSWSRQQSVDSVFNYAGDTSTGRRHDR